MEGVQGLHYRAEDAQKLQFGPVQHDFFPSKNQPDKGRPDESTHLQQRFAPAWPSASQFDHRTVFYDRNWKSSWEWDSFLLTARPTAVNRLAQKRPLPTSTSDFSEPAANLVSSSDPSLLELGLSTTAAPKDNDDDNLLALKLGGVDHLSAADELPPNVKRSRHSPTDNQTPRCQVDDCTSDLHNAKDYHRRHKVCEFHAKASKAPVSRMMQRFCQQCSRFHLLREFDDDRRSCRRRLAGHNRRRRKNQPDAAAALASMLADQNALSRIVNPLAKDELDGILKLLGGNDAHVQTVGDAGNKSPTRGTGNANDLLIELAKSQILSNLLSSDSNVQRHLPARVSSVQPSVSALSNAILLSLMQLQQKNDVYGTNAHVSIPSSTGTNSIVAASNDNVTKQNGDAMSNIGVHSASLAFPNSTEQQPSTRQVPAYPICRDDSNESNGDSTNEINVWEDSHQKQRYTQGLTRCQNKTDDDANHAQTAKFQYIGHTASSSPEEYFDTAVGSDNSSDSVLSKQEQTFQLWFKIFDRNPADLPCTLRKQLLEWLEGLPTEMEGYIRPGCIILTVYLCMPVHAWKTLCNDIERRLHNLVWNSEGDFWRKGRVLVQLGDASALLVDGKVLPNTIARLRHKPHLILVQPFAVAVGEKVDLTLKGYNLKTISTKVICSYDGDCIERGTASVTSFQYRKRDEEKVPISEDEEEEIRFHLGPFENRGHGFIEVEGQLVKGNSFPIIVADKTVCDDIRSLERKFLVNLGDGGTKTPNKQVSDIIHFLYEFGWLLQRSRWKLEHADSAEFSSARYRWLLRFAVDYDCCAVVKSTLDMLFYTIRESLEPAYVRALNILSESNLLHIAVRNNSRKMVECLLTYVCPVSVLDMKLRHVFRPDTPSHGGLTALHVAANMHAANGVLDALTNTPHELWAIAWMTAKDGTGQTPLMYAMATGNDTSVKLVQDKLQKHVSNSQGKQQTKRTINARHLALWMQTDNSESGCASTTKRTKQLQNCSCGSMQAHNLPIQIHGLYRPFVLSMLAIAAVCVCVGVLMKGPPSVNFIPGPFLWESISYGAI